MGELDRQPILKGDSSDQRTAARQRVLLSGKLVYGEDDLCVDCAIRDLSESGARVKISGPVALPARLHLIELRSGRAFDCEIAWRRMPEVGLRFLAVHALADNDARELKMLKRIWVDGTSRYALPG